MSNWKKQRFMFTGVSELDITADATSDHIDMPENYIWSVSPNIVAAVTGAPTYTVQASSDGTTWFNYTDSLTDIAIDSIAPDVEGFGFSLMRVVVTANGASAGEIQFVLGTKQI